MAKGKRFGKVFFSLLEIVLSVENDSDLVVNHWIAAVYPHRLLERHLSSLEAVEFQVLHADVE